MWFCLLGVGKAQGRVKFTPPSCHWSQDRLEEARDVSVSHFLTCASLLIPDPLEVHVPLMGIPFGEESQAFPHPNPPFKELNF